MGELSDFCLSVPLGERSYSLHIGNGLLSSGRAGGIIAGHARGGKVCIVTHPGLLRSYASPLASSLSEMGIEAAIVTVPAGERSKNLSAVARLYREFILFGLDRKGLVVSVGGGVVGDMAGFAAATYLRGIRFVQVPTTLLAQVDASVGGKTGVDLPEGKNLVGAFHQPSAVIIDPATLMTLPLRELRSGLSEVIKYGIIYDKAFLSSVVTLLPALMRRDEAALTTVIARSCEIKAEVVGQDETEQGLRAILNFGHTVGHALESVTAYRRFKHGEAIAIGMVTACLVGEVLGVTPTSVRGELCEALERAHLPQSFPLDIEADLILAAAQRDKKTEAGRLQFILARQIGEVFLSRNVPPEAVRAAIERHKGLADG